MSKLRVYFPNLNSIRFVAALAVMIHHIELTKFWFHQPNIYTSSFVGGVFGQLGIILFFVLSGFLITYLLLTEQQQTGKISIKDFYVRRVLRIWPLYYFIVLLGLFVLPSIQYFDVPDMSPDVKDHFFSKAVMFLSFVPNVAYSIYPHVPYAEQAWSVGVEEQFYLLWPFLLGLVLKTNKALRMLLGVIFAYLLIKLFIVINLQQHPNDATAESLYQFWHNFCIDCMAIGGVAAYLLFYQKEKVLKVLYNKYLQIFLYVMLAVITVKGIAVPFFTYEFYAVPFAILILNLAANKNTIVSFENKIMSYLGKISYGLYMYHNILLVVTYHIIKDVFGLQLNTALGNIAYYLLAISATIAIASLSYEFFEKRFLKLKIRYSKVVSGDNARNVEPEANTDTLTPVPLPLPPKI